MGAIASQITSLVSVYSAVKLDKDQRKHQSSASPVNSPHKGPVTPKIWWRHHGIHLATISQEIPKITVIDIILKITNVRLQPHSPVASKLNWRTATHLHTRGFAHVENIRMVDRWERISGEHGNKIRSTAVWNGYQFKCKFELLRMLARDCQTFKHLGHNNVILKRKGIRSMKLIEYSLF